MFSRYQRYAQQNRQHQSNPDLDDDVVELYFKSGDLDTEMGYKEIRNWEMWEWLIFYCLWWDQCWINTHISAFAKYSDVRMCPGTLLLRNCYRAGIFHFTWETCVSFIFFFFLVFFFPISTEGISYVMYQTYLKWYFLVFVIHAVNLRKKLSTKRSYLILGTFFNIWNLSCSQVPLKNICSAWAFQKIMNFSWRSFLIKKSLLILLYCLNFFQRNLKMVFWHTCFFKRKVFHIGKRCTQMQTLEILQVWTETHYCFFSTFFESYFSRPAEKLNHMGRFKYQFYLILYLLQ